MRRTQVQLPDDLYERARRFSQDREISLAEVVRRSLEQLLDRYPPDPPVRDWKLITIDSGGLKVPLESLRDILADEEALRSLPSRRGDDES